MGTTTRMRQLFLLLATSIVLVAAHDTASDVKALGKMHTSFLLDRSGSMSSIRDDVVGGFNQYLQEQQDAQDGNGMALTLAQFDSGNPSSATAPRTAALNTTEVESLTSSPRGKKSTNGLSSSSAQTRTLTQRDVIWALRAATPRTLLLMQTVSRRRCAARVGLRWRRGRPWHTRWTPSAAVRRTTAPISFWGSRRARPTTRPASLRSRSSNLQLSACRIGRHDNLSSTGTKRYAKRGC